MIMNLELVLYHYNHNHVHSEHHAHPLWVGLFKVWGGVIVIISTLIKWLSLHTLIGSVKITINKLTLLFYLNPFENQQLYPRKVCLIF